jgi:hypothetical protein
MGQESKEELADVYRLDTAGKGRSKNTKKAEVRSGNAESKNKKEERTIFYFLPFISNFFILTSAF